MHQYVLQFILTHRVTLFTDNRSNDEIGNNTCDKCFDRIENNCCPKCTENKSIIKTWCNPRGRCYPHPEALITNQTTFQYILQPWNMSKRRPDRIHPDFDFNGPVYDGYLDSLLISLVLQHNNLHRCETHNQLERHPFDISFWKEHEGIELLIHELSNNIKYADTLTVLKYMCYTFDGLNLKEKSKLYYGNTLWCKDLMPRLFSNYESIKNRFLALLQDAPMGNLQSPLMHMRVTSRVPSPVQPHHAPHAPHAAQTPHVSPQQMLQTTPTATRDLNNFDGGSLPTPGDSVLNDSVLRDLSFTPEHTTRKRNVKALCSTLNLHTCNDIISMLVEKQTHRFKCPKKQALFDSQEFKAETLNLKMFNVMLSAVTPDDVTDMNAIYDHVGTYMLEEKYS